MEKYLNYSEAYDEIMSIKKEGGLILGIERLVVQENGDLYADFSGIADFSDANPEESHKASLIFLSEYGLDKNEIFIITVD